MNNDSYRTQILPHLFFNKQLSTLQISKKLNKSLPLVNKMLGKLVAENDIYDKGLADSTGGRRPVTYAIRKDLMYVVAVSMDQRYTSVAIIDMERKMVKPPLEFGLTLDNDSQGLHKLSAMIQQVIEESGIEKDKLLGIGIAMPGFIDVSKGINYSFFQSKSITAHVSNFTGLPVFIDNDSSVIALSELKFGAAMGKRNAMVINVNWGVGLGIVVEGNLYRGENGFAGEFSHIPLFTNNKLCSCGKNGCLETEASLQVIVEKALAGIQRGRSTSINGGAWKDYEKYCSSVFHAAANGDRFAIELFSEVGYNIGKGLAILIHLFNPAVIIISGRGAAAGRVWMAPIQQALNEYCIPRIADATSIELSTMGQQAELIGAASLVMENFAAIDKKRLFSRVEAAK